VRARPFDAAVLTDRRTVALNGRGDVLYSSGDLKVPFMILPSFQSFLSTAVLAPLTVAAATAAFGQTQPARPAKPQAPATQPAQPSQARPNAAATPQRPAAQPTATAKPAAPAAGPAAGPGGASATLLASFGDWGVYSAQAGRSKICYALTQPKDRQPKDLKRDPAYLFVSFRPSENVRNEVALVMGFPAKENGPAEAAIGPTSYALLTKEQNAWLKNPAEEGQAITTMSKGQNLLVKVQSRRGNQLTDRYSLNGFAQALDRARKECS
jgi:cell wall-associated NlpC family hydrolase